MIGNWKKSTCHLSHLLLTYFIEDELTHEIHGRLTLIKGINRFLPAVSGGIFDEAVVFKQLVPDLKDVFYALICRSFLCPTSGRDGTQGR